MRGEDDVCPMGCRRTGDKCFVPRVRARAVERIEWLNVMQDAVVYGLFNHQGGPRGGTELRVPNWWMGMFSRKVGSSHLTINTMLSLDPLTVGKKGYRELFQV